jgi:hypothetical protein
MGSDEDMAVGFQPVLSSNGQRTAEPSGAVTDIDAHFRDLVGFAPWLWADPAMERGDDRKANAEARVLEAYVRARSFTPSQYALVHRWDLGTLRHDLIRQRTLVAIFRNDAAKAEAQRDELAAALDEIRRVFSDPLTRRALGGHSEAQQCAVTKARAALAKVAPLPQGVNARGAEAFPDNHLNEGD